MQDQAYLCRLSDGTGLWFCGYHQNRDTSELRPHLSSDKSNALLYGRTESEAVKVSAAALGLTLFAECELVDVSKLQLFRKNL
jgi:hypothetical protein